MINLTTYRAETSVARVEPLRADYLDRIFAVLSGAFGSQFTAKWEGTDPADMKAVWGNKLHRYSDQPDAIRGALDEAIELTYPPNLGEFYLMCQRRYRPAPAVSATPVLQDNRTPEERAAAVANAKATLAKYLRGEL
jgi:hypothetical protein